ncbi:PREDICTED: SEC14 cytosolic factor [Tarenaya hassleriana]|uniref:SEC14 cytosolic factor n=1 Tax=Tarenaya hassleriana TaxID=28532 RepID=UPI00053C62F6|nr:PREDICTED: SEC14 cytosolic factor [Tarenaya hassleriana]XP_010520283.1 PREDICTED: SEC14 cytosolic factor [Tarenaya hassleriana]
MGDPLHNSARSRNSVAAGVSSRKELPKKNLVAAIPRAFQQTIYKQILSVNGGKVGNGIAWNAAVFLLKIAALEAVRRISRAKCPFIWNSIQALQCLCYPPLKWIQRWAPFKGLINAMQTLSRPLLVLTIAEAFTEQSERKSEASDSITPSHTYPESHSAPNTSQSPSDTRIEDESLQPVISEDWLKRLYEELEKQQISLPERLDENELHKFYRVSNGDFACLVSSIKKTIRWRETYRILSEEELEAWSSLVFWHGYDRSNRPCLIVRLGLACLKLPSHERPRFSQAIISQVEHGVLHLIKPENPELMVLVDCEGLSPLRIPMQMMRTCSSLLQDHFPNRLGCLFVIRLPPVVRVITQTFTQILRPNTRKKLRIEGEMFQRILCEYIQTLPSYLGGDCNCKRCSNPRNQNSDSDGRSKREAGRIEAGEWRSSNYNLEIPDLAVEDGPDMNICNQVLRTAVMLLLMLWLFGALIAGIIDPETRPF